MMPVIALVFPMMPVTVLVIVLVTAHAFVTVLAIVLVIVPVYLEVSDDCRTHMQLFSMLVIFT
ncbi:MAG: hypothetical protein ACFFEK_14580 [Candidatus Thorarchaeota archaeon]